MTWPGDFSSGGVLKLGRLRWISNGGELNASGLGKTNMKVICQPKREVWVLSKYKAN